MRNRTSINMGNLLLSLSNAVDLANPAIAQHQQRTAYIALEICRTAGYSIEQITDIFTAALLHDVGAISIEEKILLHRFETENVAQHCLRGELLLKRVPEFAKTALIVKYHHTPWTQIREMPQTEITAAAQVIQLADYIERLIDRDSYILNQTDDIMQQVKAISGSMIDPGVVAFFNDFYEREEFWLDLISPRLYWHLFHPDLLKM